MSIPLHRRLIWCYLIAGAILANFATAASDHDYQVKLGVVPMSAKFVSDEWTHWGGSLVKGDDGLYHMFYSRWETKLGWAWVTDSEIAHAVSTSPFGPFEFRDVALPPRGADFWDGLCTHNPTVRKFGDKYYLYYMGNTGDGKVVGVPGRQDLNWVHRNNQRIGVAVADNPNGPWQRFDEPLIDITPDDDDALDALMTSNPSITQRPDGGFLMVYKVVGKKHPLPNGGPVLHAIAAGDTPLGPFVKHPEPTFVVPGDPFPAEDPFIWHQDGKYRAVVKHIEKQTDPDTGKQLRIFSLVQFESVNGFDWLPSQHHEINNRVITWADGTVEHLDHLERPQVFFEDGRAIALLCAADIYDENNVRRAYNVQIPMAFE